MANSTQTTIRAKRQAAQPELGPVEQVPIDLLKPYPANARTHDKRQLFKIKQSLESFGWMNPILAQKDGTIIAGHGRWLAAKELGYATCPVIRFEHLSEDQFRAYRLADNRLAELSGWDDEMVAIELQHLSSIDLDFSIETIGWDHVEIDMRCCQSNCTSRPSASLSAPWQCDGAEILAKRRRSWNFAGDERKTDSATSLPRRG